MRAPCTQCRKVSLLDSFHKIDYSDDGISLLCSKECEDAWDSRVPPEEDSDPTCEQCKGTLTEVESPVEFWTYAEPFNFCSQMCRDRWLLQTSLKR